MTELELYHYGIKGMKWGVRRYQNKDGSLTPAGKKRVYKTLKKYANNKKDRRGMLGQAVGEDETITNAARKAVPALKNYRKAVISSQDMERKMEIAYFKELDRLDRKDEGTPRQRDDMARKSVRDKYGKDNAKIQKRLDKAYGEYKDALKNICDEYLGKYGDKPINSKTTASESLSTQIDWGIQLGRLGIDEDLSY